MKPVDSHRLRSLYLRFFESRGHARIDGAPIVADWDPRVLFTSAGMHPLVPYLLGQPHPQGGRLVGMQACLRTSDIEEVGDDSHLTSFEMLGNWSLGDYGPEQSIRWTFELLTDERQLGIELDRLWFTVFGGGHGLPPDETAPRTWLDLGVPRSRVVSLGVEHNWWSLGGDGPCGPDTEVFFDRTGQPCARGSACDPSCSCGRFVEIWNNVFMTHERVGEELRPLPRVNVDTGMGVERTVSVLGGHDDVFGVEPLCDVLEHLEGRVSLEVDAAVRRRSLRIATDHLRTCVRVLSDPRSPRPSPQGEGSVLRRLIRRACVHLGRLGISPRDWVDSVVHIGGIPTQSVLLEECERFERVRRRGQQQLERSVLESLRTGRSAVDPEVVFRLHETHGFPIELSTELVRERGLTVDAAALRTLLHAHRRRSRPPAKG